MAVAAMTHQEQLDFLVRVINKGSQVFEARVVGDKIEFVLDDSRYLVSIRKASGSSPRLA